MAYPRRRLRKSGTSLPASLQPTVRDWVHNLILEVSGHPSWPESAYSQSLEWLARLLLAPSVLARAVAVDRAHRGGRGVSESLGAYARRHAGEPRTPVEPPQPVLDNLSVLTRLLGLDETERACLFFGAVFSRPSLGECLQPFGSLIGARPGDLVACATGRGPEDVWRAAGPRSRLARLGLMAPDLRGRSYHLSMGFDVNPVLHDWLLAEHLTEEAVLERIVPTAPLPTLGWEEHAAVAGEARFIEAVLRGALARGTRGVHVLLHGRSGTGKTELARLLATELGVPLHACGREDHEGKSPSPAERLSSLLLGQALLKGRPGLLLFDELEDLFEERYWPGRGPTARNASSKVWLNELLEDCGKPTLWTSNRIEHLDPAVLRRFTYVVEMPALGQRQRQRVLSRELGSQASQAVTERLAGRYDASPAQLVGAVRTARLVSAENVPCPEDIERVLAASVRATGGGKGPSRGGSPPEGYRLDGLNGPPELLSMIERLAGWGPKGDEGLTLCLYGPPGTGKSELARYLGWRMGRPVVERHASDLLSCWVGETEKRIAAAFREAEAAGALLLFDEVDSFLRARATATHSWEATQTNEFLTRLESARGLVVCTTNEWEKLDPAAMRRFVFKIELRPLGAEQAARVFESVLGPHLLAPLDECGRRTVQAVLGRLSLLTPGDLAAVRRKVAVLGVRYERDALLAEVAAEVAHKRGPRARIGFGEALSA